MTCAICAADTNDGLVTPLGRNDAMVAICRRCDGEHPRRGRYSFSGGRSVGPLAVQDPQGNSSHDRNGKRRGGK